MPAVLPAAGLAASVEKRRLLPAVRALTFLVLGWTSVTALAHMAPPPLEPGISRELAAWRASHYRDIHYRLQLEIGQRADTLRGTVEIEVTLAGPQVPDLILDWRPTSPAARLHASSVNGQPAQWLFEQQHLRIPAALLHAGRNRVSVAFESPIALSGSAVTRYRDGEDGSDYVYSLFVPSDASSAFPCLDQPSLKARFSLQLTVPKAWRAVSNSPVAKARAGDGSTSWRFAETPPISTYVFAFAAGPFVALRSPGDQTQLWVRKSRVERARKEVEQVLSLNRRGLRWMETYFDRPFPFAKYDLVLIPEFAYGGMEHAGASFLREESVLFPSQPDETDLLRRAQLLFHEASHQWFGDLVTMRWFDDLWLKEGFANLVASKATEALLPQFNAWGAFHALKVSAYRTDVTRGTTPIYQALPNLASAKSAYGNIVYSKAPAVLRQAEFYVGEAAFRDGVRSFLRRHAFGAADWGDLVQALERASSQDLSRWATAWVTRRGMPRVRVSWETGPDGKVTEALLTQEDVLGEGGVWPMKLRLMASYESGENRSIDARLEGKSLRLGPLEGRPPPRFIFANVDDYGYGQFLLDAQSRSAILDEPAAVPGALLRALVFDALWESVRETDLAPVDYLHFAFARVVEESDPVTLATFLGRIEIAYRHYLSPTQRERIAPELERLLLDSMQRAETPGRRIAFLRAFTGLASSEQARKQIKDLLRGALRVPGVELASRDRFRLIARLMILDDPDAASLLAAQGAVDRSDDGRRYAYAAGAARRDADTKQVYFVRALQDTQVPESWTEAALGPLNAVEHSALSLPLLQPALEALPDLKHSRKIFFVNNWLASFLGGQTGPRALDTVRHFLDRAPLDADLRLKVLEAVDPLERTIRIRARSGER
jgi:aminopeptidase N